MFTITHNQPVEIDRKFHVGDRVYVVMGYQSCGQDRYMLIEGTLLRKDISLEYINGEETDRVTLYFGKEPSLQVAPMEEEHPWCEDLFLNKEDAREELEILRK